MNTPSTFPRSLVAALLLSASFAMAHAADPAVSDESPIPPVVRARLAEAAKGAGLHDYSVDQRAGGVVYTARFTEPSTGREQLVTVTQEGRLVGVEAVESGGEATPPPLPKKDDKGAAAVLPDPQTAPPAPMREDGKDAAPQTRKGVGQESTPGVTPP